MNAERQHPFISPPPELTDVVLNHLSSFHPLTPELKADLRQKLCEVKVSKGTYLLRQGETSNYLYLILSGIIVGYTERKGRKLTTYICADGDSVSSISGMYGLEPSDENMYAVEDSHLIGLKVSDLLAYLEHSFEMNIVIRKIVEEFYKMAHERSNLVRMGTAQEKYEYYINTMPRYVDRIPIEYIADFLDINQKTLQKILKVQKTTAETSIQEQLSAIERYMSESQAFKRHGITLEGMANDLLMPKHQLSHILNVHYKKGFNTFINEYRIDYIKEKLRNNSEWQRLKIESLGMEGGFSSRSVFFSEFRTKVGLTPAEYAKSISKISPEL